jgi:hypothetical protein
MDKIRLLLHWLTELPFARGNDGKSSRCSNPILRPTFSPTINHSKTGRWIKIAFCPLPDEIRRTRQGGFPMNRDLAEAIHKILAKQADGAFATLADSDFLFFHCLVNYAKAKNEAANITKVLRSIVQDRKQPDSRMAFTALLRQYAPIIEPSEAEALLDAIAKDNPDPLHR